jgi:P4 family phage/plasmid primase-like protien
MLNQNNSTKLRRPAIHGGITTTARMLGERMEELALHLLGTPNKKLSTSDELRFGNRGSISVNIGGAEPGVWYDHEAGKGGGALELIQHVQNCDLKEACAWAENWLGLAPMPAALQPSAPKTRKPKAEPVPEVEVELAAPPPAEPPSVPTEFAAKVANIIVQSGPAQGTPAEIYLRSRGITMPLPQSICYREGAMRQYGALVGLATDDAGEVLAVQQVYLTSSGEKAAVHPPKRTNKAVEGWAERSAVRLPGKAPIILCEGIVTALSLAQATGQETWACLGISNMAKAPLPDGAEVIVARDGDIPGSPADGQIERALATLKDRGFIALLASPPQDQDFNDVLQGEGEEAVRMAIAEAVLPDAFGKTGTKEVYIGSDVELAQRVREDLTERLGRIVHAEGAFWHYERTHWKPVPDRLLRVTVHRYDGAEYKTPSGEPSRVKLGKGRIDSILNECATLCSEPDFFITRPIGINCASGFIQFDGKGAPTLVPHNQFMRCRHTLPGQWQLGNGAEPPEGSLLAKLLGGAFLGDPEANDKVTLLAEVCGAAALGYATHLIQPKAVILYGQTAENGKSQILDLARGLLPANAICSVPAARMGDERHVIGLVGKLLNATDELSSAAVASDTFKSIVTGEPIEGRDVYKSRIEFRSIAQNLFATNNLPAFQGGIDRGVQRRLLVIPFNRTIPKEERIENIGQRIAGEEADLLLAWVVAGAARLVAHRNFTIPTSCAQALTEWIFGADPVLAWLDECTEVFPFVPNSPYLTTRSAYASFQNWATTEGFKGDKLPAINGFVQRIQANVSGISYKRTSVGRVFMGLRIKTAHGA